MKTLRIASGLSARKFAERLEVSPRTYESWEQMQAEPAQEAVRQMWLAKAREVVNKAKGKR